MAGIGIRWPCIVHGLEVLSSKRRGPRVDVDGKGDHTQDAAMGFRRFARTTWRVPACTFALGAVAMPVVPLFGIMGIILGILMLVARVDDETGTFLPLAVLSMIALAAMIFLVAGLAIVHALMSASA